MKNLKEKLELLKKEGGFLEFERSEDIASVTFVNNNFRFEFNGKGMFSIKTLKIFIQKLEFQLHSKGLELVIE